MGTGVSEPAIWRVLIPWPSAGARASRFDLRASAPERASIARHLDLESVERLEADLSAAPWLDGLTLSGRLEAEVGRICGVTLEPFVERVSEAVLARFLPPDSLHLPPDQAGEIVIDPSAEDPPEAGEDDGVDVGALVIELLALALDPFPRRPDAVFEAPATDAAPSPFSVLAALKSASQSSR
jgi:hypothetical protein